MPTLNIFISINEKITELTNASSELSINLFEEDSDKFNLLSLSDKLSIYREVYKYLYE